MILNGLHFKRGKPIRQFNFPEDLQPKEPFSLIQHTQCEAYDDS